MQEQGEPGGGDGNKWADLKPCKFISPDKPVFIPGIAPIEDKRYYILNSETGKRTLYHERWIGGRCSHICRAASLSRCGELVDQ